MNEKITTIEDLAVMVKHGFDAVDKRFDQVEGRLDKMDDRFDQIDGRLDHIDARLGRVEADMHEMREGVVYRHELEDKLGRIKYIERKLDIESGV